VEPPGIGGKPAARITPDGREPAATAAKSIVEFVTSGGRVVPDRQPQPPCTLLGIGTLKMNSSMLGISDEGNAAQILKPKSPAICRSARAP
jgi:hypothetical protein